MGTSKETNERALRLVGTMLRDKWRLDALIGIGGMASVYAATHRNGKRAAIKLLHRDLSDGDSTKARFLREGYVANKVGHSGVVNVIDDDTSEDGRAFLVMELLEGETLKARWSRWNKRMPVDEVLRIAHELLDILAAAHDKGIVHRDIKPDNIFLTNDGAVKVLDFGIARLRETGELADATRSTAMLGTPAFMAPEQARSRWEWVDARTDVWAVGATMFTVLSGQFVHNAATVTELIMTAAMMPARPIQSVAPELPDSVAAIVDRALAFEQAQRWPDARAMQYAIGFALQPSTVKPMTTQPMAQVTTNPAPVRGSESNPATNPVSAREISKPSSSDTSDILAAPVAGPLAMPVGPAAPVTNTVTAPFPDPRQLAAANAKLTKAPLSTALATPIPGSAPNSQVQIPAPAPSNPAPPSHPSYPSHSSNPGPSPNLQRQVLGQSQPGGMQSPLLGQSQPGGMQSPLLAQSQPGGMQSPLLAQSQPGGMQSPLLAQSQPGGMQSPLLAVPAPLAEPPGFSTLGSAATVSATLDTPQPRPKTNPLVFAAVGAIFFLGLVAAFFIIRSGGESENKETNASTPLVLPSQVSSTPSPSMTNPSPIATEAPAPTDDPTAIDAPTVEAEPADSANTVDTTQPRKTHSTKRRNPTTGTKKKDPFDTY